MNDKEMLFKISLLISKSLSGDITKEEQTELDSWREKSEYNKKLFERICSAQFLTDDIYPKCPQILNGVSHCRQDYHDR